MIRQPKDFVDWRQERRVRQAQRVALTVVAIGLIVYSVVGLWMMWV